ncbi:MAG: ribonuclease HII [Brevinematia bacterium]
MRIEELEALIKSFEFVVGIDEVGRGCIAGPMFVCSVVIPTNLFIKGVKDSKILSKTKREKLFPRIVENVHNIGIGVVSNDEIDKFGMSISLRLAIIKSLINLKFLPKLIITDYVHIKNTKFGEFLETQILDKNKRDIYLSLYNKIQKFDEKTIFNDKIYYISIKKADRYVHANSIASIIAKVLRDRYMNHISIKYPVYSLHKNKGYPSKEHIEAIKKYGLSNIHRKSFKLKNLIY